MMVRSRLFVFIVLLSAFHSQAQDIEGILDRNPFDPNRGREEVVVKEKPKEKVPDVDFGFILDGTVLMKDHKVAIIRYFDEPRRIVENNAKRSANNRRKARNLRNRKIRRNVTRRAKETRERKIIGLNEKLHGHTVTFIGKEEVRLSIGDETKVLRLYSGKKENRGGSKPMPGALAKKSKTGVIKQADVKDAKRLEAQKKRDARNKRNREKSKELTKKQKALRNF